MKSDGSHVCLYCGPDGGKAIAACVNPTGEFVATAAFIRPTPTKKRSFGVDLVEPKKSKAPKAPKG
jgi:hypothetical protein